MNNQSLIKASEINEYIYCKRAWWLRFNGDSGNVSAMNEGLDQHNKLSNMLLLNKKLLTLAIIVMLLGLLLLLAALLLSLFNLL
jgi:CRISPR/Cas system-associated exonuclease Cas4 (RecB family)